MEAEEDSVYLWTETDSEATFGSRLARFPFEDGKTLTRDSQELEKHLPIENADNTTVNIDSAHGLLTMRYRKDEVFHFSVFPLEEVKKGRYNPTATVRQPSMGTFQGFVSYGDFLYLLAGNQYGAYDSNPPEGNTYIVSVHLKTGKVVEKQLISAAQDLPYREPEGMSILIQDPKKPEKAELAFGFASGESGARLANIYTLKDLVPAEPEDP